MHEVMLLLFLEGSSAHNARMIRCEDTACDCTLATVHWNAQLKLIDVEALQE
jgi:hypothetical protein